MVRMHYRQKLLVRLMVGILTAAMLFGTVATASAEPNAPLQSPYETRIQELQNRVSQLEGENTRLYEQNTELTKQNDKLRTTVAKLSKTAKRLRSRLIVAVRRLRALLRRLAGMFGPWRSARASWYGPGFYGSGLAGGGVLRRGMRIFAHRSMKFGTKVQFRYRGRSVVAVCKDRGPFIAGRAFDLGPGTATALRFDGVATVRWRVVR